MSNTPHQFIRRIPKSTAAHSAQGPGAIFKPNSLETFITIGPGNFVNVQSNNNKKTQNANLHLIFYSTVSTVFYKLEGGRQDTVLHQFEEHFYSTANHQARFKMLWVPCNCNCALACSFLQQMLDTSLRRPGTVLDVVYISE